MLSGMGGEDRTTQDSASHGFKLVKLPARIQNSEIHHFGNFSVTPHPPTAPWRILVQTWSWGPPLKRDVMYRRYGPKGDGRKPTDGKKRQD